LFKGALNSDTLSSFRSNALPFLLNLPFHPGTTVSPFFPRSERIFASPRAVVNESFRWRPMLMVRCGLPHSFSFFLVLNFSARPTLFSASGFVLAPFHFEIVSFFSILSSCALGPPLLFVPRLGFVPLSPRAFGVRFSSFDFLTQKRAGSSLSLTLFLFSLPQPSAWQGLLFLCSLFFFLHVPREGLAFLWGICKFEGFPTPQ